MLNFIKRMLSLKLYYTDHWGRSLIQVYDWEQTKFDDRGLALFEDKDNSGYYILDFVGAKEYLSNDCVVYKEKILKIHRHQCFTFKINDIKTGRLDKQDLPTLFKKVKWYHIVSAIKSIYWNWQSWQHQKANDKLTLIYEQEENKMQNDIKIKIYEKKSTLLSDFVRQTHLFGNDAILPITSYKYAEIHLIEYMAESFNNDTMRHLVGRNNELTSTIFYAPNNNIVNEHMQQMHNKGVIIIDRLSALSDVLAKSIKKCKQNSSTKKKK